MCFNESMRSAGPAAGAAKTLNHRAVTFIEFTEFTTQREFKENHLHSKTFHLEIR